MSRGGETVRGRELMVGETGERGREQGEKTEKGEGSGGTAGGRARATVLTPGLHCRSPAPKRTCSKSTHTCWTQPRGPFAEIKPPTLPTPHCGWFGSRLPVVTAPSHLSHCPWAPGLVSKDLSECGDREAGSAVLCHLRGESSRLMVGD